jgi:hypothetical protein
MNESDFGMRLRIRLGPEACEDLSNAFMEAQNEMLITLGDRFDGRLVGFGAELRADLVRTQSELRQEMAQMDAGLRVAFMDSFSKLRADLAEVRVETLRWSFLFWVGQLAAMAALLAYMLRSR